jgi:hypothetical protein
MKVGGRELFAWSFLMASAHGAGLMILPVLMAKPLPGTTHHMAGAMTTMTPPLSMSALTPSTIGLAVLVHTASMLAVAGILALAFFETYETVGLRLLRHTWLNFDLLWAIALMTAGVAVLFF